jgi:hypothetical protein
MGPMFRLVGTTPDFVAGSIFFYDRRSFPKFSFDIRGFFEYIEPVLAGRFFSDN